MNNRSVPIPWVKGIVYTAASLFFFYSLGETAQVPTPEAEHPLERRHEKLELFRQRRDRFFKEDPHSPLPKNLRTTFRGLNYFPIDLKYAIPGTIEKIVPSQQTIYVNLPTNKGKEKKYIKSGKFRFSLDGRALVLYIYRPLGGGELFLPFKDRTAEKDTYPRGRYLFIEPLPDGKVLVDFNRAYNPFCAYNERFTCPFAPPENWLDLEIRAGEKRFSP